MLKFPDTDGDDSEMPLISHRTIKKGNATVNRNNIGRVSPENFNCTLDEVMSQVKF